jgi:hypothetical protein
LVAAPSVLRRPDLWATAVRQWGRLTPKRWWRRRPYLPVPDREWMRFRFETQYGGDGNGPIVAEDVVAFLVWCRDMRRSERADW